MNVTQAYHLLASKLETWLQELIKLLPNILIAALVLVLGFFIARLVKRLSLKLIRKVSRLETINVLFSSFTSLIIISVTIFTALSILKLDKAVTTILAGAGIIGLALAFAFQYIAANFMSGIFISIRRPFNVGDIVKVKDYIGKVQKIDLRDTVILTFQGQDVIIPNKEVFQNPIENYSSFGKRRMDLRVGISYGEDLERVRQVTLEAARKVSVRSKEDDITFFYEAFGDSSINFLVRIWINSGEISVFLQARSEAIMHIKKAYDENNIMIPFPIRTLDFGIKGGEKLSEIEIKVLNKRT